MVGPNDGKSTDDAPEIGCSAGSPFLCAWRKDDGKSAADMQRASQTWQVSNRQRTPWG